MQKPALPDNEADRLAALRRLKILDTSAEERFDRYTRLIKRLMDVPIALISLIDEDRQWFKSRCGLDEQEMSRDISFCGHAILNEDVMVVADATEDSRFSDNPLVTGAPNIRFYAGCPLVAPGGYKVGTLCIVDNKRRELDEADLATLRDFADMVAAEMVTTGIATTDVLTGLSNRMGLEPLFERSLRARGVQDSACLMLFDMDGSTSINEQYGPDACDAAIVEFGQLLVESFGDLAIVARLRGDNFCAFQPDAVVDRPGTLLKRLQRAVDDRNTHGHPFPIRYASTVIRCGHDRGIEDVLLEASALIQEQKAASGGRGSAG